MEAVVEQTEFKCLEDVRTVLDKILSDLEGEEIERRVQKTLGYDGFRPSKPFTNLDKQVVEFITKLQLKYSPEEIARIEVEARSVVSQIKQNNQRREYFDGKKVIEVFYRDYIAKANLKKTVFLFLAAKEARNRKSVSKFFKEMFDDLIKETRS
jgi:hypothetical protein